MFTISDSIIILIPQVIFIGLFLKLIYDTVMRGVAIHVWGNNQYRMLKLALNNLPTNYVQMTLEFILKAAILAIAYFTIVGGLICLVH